jgi:hypothetical protein
MRIEFICLIVNRHSLNRVYSGGSDQFIDDWGPFDGRSSDYDDHMVKVGAMNSSDIDNLILELSRIGLYGLCDVDGKKFWVDFCVVDELVGLRARCDWIGYDYDDRTIFYVGPA